MNKIILYILLSLTPLTTLSQPEELLFNSDGAIKRLFKLNNTLYYSLENGQVNYIDLNDLTYTSQTLITSLNEPVGMEHKNGFLYIADWGDYKVVKVDLTETNPVPIDVTLGQRPNDLLFIGDILYISNNTSHRIYKYDINSGTQMPEFDFAVQGSPIGLEYKDGYLYIASALADTVYRKNLSDGNSVLEVVIDDIIQPDLDHPINLEFLGNDLYIAGNISDKIFKVDISNPPYNGEEVLNYNSVRDLLIDDGILYYCNSAFIYKVELSSLSIDDFYTQKTRIFPNPAKDKLNLTNIRTSKNYEIYDPFGRIVQKGIINLNNKEIFINNLMNGVYFLNIEKDTSLKFIKN